MEETRHRSHQASEDLWGCGQTKAEDPELPGPLSGSEPEKPARLRVDRNLKVSILQIYGDYPVVPPHGTKNSLRSLHPKRSPIHIQVQGGQVDNQPPTPRNLGDNEHVSLEAWSWRRRLHRSLAAKSLNLLLQSPPLTDWGEYESRKMEVRERGGGMRKGIAYPSLKTSTTQGSAPLVPPSAPPEGQTAAYHCWARSLTSLATSSRLEAGEEP